MNLSIKTKFYIFVLPILIVLPILLYSFVAPYSQLQEAFHQFEDDAAQALLAEEFVGTLETEQLELFHSILGLNGKEDEHASAAKFVNNSFEKLKSEILLNAGENSESGKLIEEKASKPNH